MLGQIDAIQILRNALSLFTLFNPNKNAVYYLFVRFRIDVRAEGAVSVQSNLESLLIARPDENYQAQLHVYMQQYRRYIINFHKDIHVNMHRFIKVLDRNQHLC